MRKRMAPHDGHYRLGNTNRSMMPPREKGEFYKKDRKVLRFFCKYKDDRLLGDKRDYILHYYLLNDTIEIKEVGVGRAARFPRKAVCSTFGHQFGF